MEGRRWHRSRMCFCVQVSPLVDALVIETGAELTEMDIASCWSQGATQTPLQKKDGPFTNIITFLDELARCVLSTWAWDKMVYPPLLLQDSMPCRSQHLGHILGNIIDIGNSMLTFQFQITEQDGKFVGVMTGLLFEGHLLPYDPTYNVAEWVPLCRMVVIYHLLKTPWHGN